MYFYCEQILIECTVIFYYLTILQALCGVLFNLEPINWKDRIWKTAAVKIRDIPSVSETTLIIYSFIDVL